MRHNKVLQSVEGGRNSVMLRSFPKSHFLLDSGSGMVTSEMIWKAESKPAIRMLRTLAPGQELPLGVHATADQPAPRVATWLRPRPATPAARALSAHWGGGGGHMRSSGEGACTTTWSTTSSEWQAWRQRDLLDSRSPTWLTVFPCFPHFTSIASSGLLSQLTSGPLAEQRERNLHRMLHQHPGMHTLIMEGWFCSDQAQTDMPWGWAGGSGEITS